MATEYVGGTALVLQWIYSGGTLSLAADTRSVAWTPSVETIDTTAGSDTVRTYINSFKSASATISMVDQTNAAGTATAFDAGVRGTLIIGPEGTAVGKRKITFPSMSSGGKYTWPYDGIAEISVEFVAVGAYTDGTY